MFSSPILLFIHDWELQLVSDCFSLNFLHPLTFLTSLISSFIFSSLHPSCFISSLQVSFYFFTVPWLWHDHCYGYLQILSALFPSDIFSSLSLSHRSLSPFPHLPLSPPTLLVSNMHPSICPSNHPCPHDHNCDQLQILFSLISSILRP